MDRKAREEHLRERALAKKAQRAQVKREVFTQLPWTPFEKADHVTLDGGKTWHDVPEGYEVYVNSRYEVHVRQIRTDMGDVAHLSIRDRDRSARHDWRDFQRIKNEIVGPEYEAVEKYPKESHLVDTSNQYHLYVFLDRETELPFGFTERLVMEHPELAPQSTQARQRPWEPGTKPKDAIEPGSPQWLQVTAQTYAYNAMATAQAANPSSTKEEPDVPEAG